MHKEKGRSIKYLDYNLIAVIVALMCFGLVMLYSASAKEILSGETLKWTETIVFRQFGFSVVGIIGMIFLAVKADYHWYGKFATAIYIFAFFLMFLVRFGPESIKVTVNGSARWLRVPGIGITFQPSEVMKVALIIFIPFVICSLGKKFFTLKGTALATSFGFLGFIGIFRLTDNMSTAIIALGIVCIVVFVAHKETKLFVGLAMVLLVLVGIYLFYLTSQYNNNLSSGEFRNNRILAWLYPQNFEDTVGFQVSQGLFAIGSGGFWGKGIGRGVQKLVIPEVQNDMILAVIGEELGIVGIFFVFLLFGILLYRILLIARNARDLYGFLVSSGVFAHLALQVLLNAGVVLRMLPTTGVTLPFISHGGTSLLILMAEMGIVLNVSRQIKMEE